MSAGSRLSHGVSALSGNSVWQHFSHRHITMIAALVGSLTIAESIYWLSSRPMTWQAAVIFALRVAVIVWFVCSPGTGSYGVVASQCIDFLAPQVSPASMLLMALLAVGVMSFLHARQAAVLGLVLWLGAFGNLISDQTSFMKAGGLVSYGAFIVIAHVTGRFTRTVQWRRAQEERNRRIAEGTGIAQRLHDYTMNDLSDIIMLADAALDAEDDSDSVQHLQQIRDEARDALVQTRNAITAMKGSDTATEHTEQRQQVSNLHYQVSDLVDEQQELLASLGFQGTVLTPNPLPECREDDARLVVGLLRELFGNIMRHADARQGYTLAICTDGHYCDISLADKPNEPGLTALPSGLGSGLRHYQQEVTGRGGEWSVQDGSDSWSLHATIQLVREPQ